MLTTYGPFYITTYSPTSNNTECASDTAPVLKYVYAPPNSQVQLVESFSSILTQDYALFYVDFATNEFESGAIAYIYVLDGSTKYFLGKPSDNETVFTFTLQNKSGAIRSWNIGTEVNGNIVTATSLSETSTTGTNTYIQLLASNLWLLNYVKDGDDFSDNDYVSLDEISSNRNDTPLTTNDGKSSCTYRFNFNYVNVATYSFVSSTNPMLQSDNLKMKIYRTSNNIAIDVFRSRCYVRGNSISCTRNSENLLSLVGRKSTLEPGFDYSYRVRAKVNNGIVDNRCAINSKLSLYNIDTGYLIVKYCDSYSLLTNEIAPSCGKMQHLIRKMENFINKCKSNHS